MDRPNLTNVFDRETNDYKSANKRFWRIYLCGRCGGLVTAFAYQWDIEVAGCFPEGVQVESAIPDRARQYLEQAVNSLHAPAGAVMLAASGVDAMLKAKSYNDGSLYSRIDGAVKDHLITTEMGQWAHEVRLDANDQRHSDDNAPLPTSEDARRAIDFALALGQFLFVLPARVQRGIAAAASGT